MPKEVAAPSHVAVHRTSRGCMDSSSSTNAGRGIVFIASMIATACGPSGLTTTLEAAPILLVHADTLKERNQRVLSSSPLLKSSSFRRGVLSLGGPVWRTHLFRIGSLTLNRTRREEGGSASLSFAEEAARVTASVGMSE